MVRLAAVEGREVVSQHRAGLLQLAGVSSEEALLSISVDDARVLFDRQDQTVGEFVAVAIADVFREIELRRMRLRDRIETALRARAGTTSLHW